MKVLEFRLPRSLRFLAMTSGAGMLLLLAGCSGKDPQPVEYYQPAFRTSGPERIYSRVMWSHLPKPVTPRSRATAPLLLPTVSFSMPDSTFEKAIEALAQAMGYRWKYPSSVSSRKVSIEMEGTLDEVLAEISKQAKVSAIFDHQYRLIRVLDKEMVPALPKS